MSWRIMENDFFYAAEGVWSELSWAGRIILSPFLFVSFIVMISGAFFLFVVMDFFDLRAKRWPYRFLYKNGDASSPACYGSWRATESECLKCIDCECCRKFSEEK